MTRTLLVVDDDRSVRDSLQFLFELRGYRVFVAESGVKAMNIMTENIVDGAMIDVHMPGMNGIAACRVLRAQAAAAGRPLAVWMMTAAKTAELAKAATEAGALILLRKPFDHAELFRRFDQQFAERPPWGDSSRVER